MTDLPLCYENKSAGFSYKLVKARLNVGLYVETTPGREQMTYEVIIFRYRREKEFHGKIIKGGLKFPSEKDWGSYGWTVVTINRATERFKSAVARDSKGGVLRELQKNGLCIGSNEFQAETTPPSSPQNNGGALVSIEVLDD